MSDDQPQTIGDSPVGTEAKPTRTLFKWFGTGSAVLSEDGRYRYLLTREWDEDGPRCCWIMLNPSTADASLDDPTIRRCVGFSKAWGFGSLIVANLFALRATSPKDLLVAPDPTGPLNENAIAEAIVDCSRVVFAWGTFVEKVWRVNLNGIPTAGVEMIARSLGREYGTLGKTKDGWPKHPLYVPAAQPFLAEWTPADSGLDIVGGDTSW